ncbi:3'-5' exonuclease [Acidiphilium sp.]|uniref:3'-5' exonuclease n=1 Tax=Acidiphilium sp. TaxID=527 RepID=UPI003D0211C9
MTEEEAQRLEEMARTLSASGVYRVLRKLAPRTRIEVERGTSTRTGLFVDVETTGLDAETDEIIEIAIVPFTYALDGRIIDVGERFQSFRDPGRPIPPEVMALTGITDAMVANQTIDMATLEGMVAPAALVVAHNAAFDRRFIERLCPAFAGKPWACSMTEVDWVAEGFEGRKLAYLAMGAGFFYDRHRAVNDCLAAIELLAMPLPHSGVIAMSRLLASARSVTCRIWAEGAPFEHKDDLKRRGYRWSGDAGFRPRTWYIDVPDSKQEDEIAYLKTSVLGAGKIPPVQRITAYDRFSKRG